jgi:LuxR family transcriptional regulator, regulator of acetate metabolism
MLGVIEAEDTRLTEAERLDVAAGVATDSARAAEGAEAIGLYELSLELHELRAQATSVRHAEHLLALSRIEESMRRLAALETPEAIIARAAAEVCRACGFERAMMSSIEGATLAVEAIHVESPDPRQQTFIEVAKATPPRLVHLLAETELLRRRSAILVTEPDTDPRTFKPLVTASRTPGYVAAPVVPCDQVIAIVHADHGVHGPLPDDLDREAIRSFALGLGWAIERAQSRQRLAEQSQRVRRVARMLDDVLTTPGENDPRLPSAPDPEFAGITPSSMPSSTNLLDELLTRREREVLELLAEGASNNAIAERLVIAEATVKSHVKHILRKMRAANRTEAVSRYARLRERPDRV